MRLTSREKEILGLLKKEPLISQEELAQKFGITRSSVAVHISNLMKKGAVLGKGYVLNEVVTIVVVGDSGLKVNVIGQAANATVDIEWTGFALEASQTLADFGASVKVVTVIGQDEQGDLIVNRLMDNKVDTSNIYRHNGKRTARCVTVDGATLYQEGYSSEDYEKAISQREWVIFNCEWLVVEQAWQEYIYCRSLGKNGDKLPFFCTCKAVQQPQTIPDYLTGYDWLVLGLKDFTIVDFYLHLAREMINKGLGHCVITDGTSGVIHLSTGGVQEFPLLPNQSFHYSDRLPYLLCGLVYGLSSGYPLRQAVRIGVGNAANNEGQ